mmetsp:Transcript_17982/g.51249  ORF Transcript_17982/g.51249 Transcript_17982/m.51249 type:complete len:656 (+) Transcript_17982:77-2044(+)
MEKPETPVAERVRRRGPLNDSPAIRRACADVEEEEKDLARRLKRVREDRAHLDQIAEEQQRKKQRRAMPGGVRAPKGPTDEYGDSSDDEEEEDPPPPPSRRKRGAPSPSGDGAEAPVKRRRRIIEESSDEDEEVAEAPRPSEPALPEWPRSSSTVCAALRGLGAQIEASKVGRKVIFLDVKSSGEDPKVDCPLEVAVALDREDRFSTLLAHTVDPSDAAVKAHGLSAQKLRELNAPTPKEAYSRLLAFLSERAPDENVLFVGHENLCSKAVPILVRGLRECELPTTLFEKATYLQVAGMLPGGVVGDEEGLNLSRDDLYEALTKKRVPAAASRADVSNFANLVVLGCSLKIMGWDFDAVAVGARLADAVPGLLLEEAAASSSEEEALRISSEPFDDACWRGRKKTRGAQWVYASTGKDLADAWDIPEVSISRLAGVSTTAPSAAHAAKFEVEQLHARSRRECAAKSSEASRDDAFHARRDGERLTRHGWATLSRSRGAMCKALKRLYSDQILYAKLGRPPSHKEATKWFKECYTNPPCACNRRAKTCDTNCTTCGDCVNKNGGRVVDHTEVVMAKASEIPGGFAFLARMRASVASDDAKYLVAWHRPCVQCNKCNRGLVLFGDRSHLSTVEGSAERSKAAKQKASKLSTLFGYGA